MRQLGSCCELKVKKGYLDRHSALACAELVYLRMAASGAKQTPRDCISEFLKAGTRNEAKVYRVADGRARRTVYPRRIGITSRKKCTPPVTGGVYGSPQEKDEQNNGKRDSK